MSVGRPPNPIPPFTEQLRTILVEAKTTRYRISKDTGVPEQTLSKFINGQQGSLRAEYLNALASYFRLTIKVGKQR